MHVKEVDLASLNSSIKILASLTTFLAGQETMRRMTKHSICPDVPIIQDRQRTFKELFQDLLPEFSTDHLGMVGALDVPNNHEMACLG